MHKENRPAGERRRRVVIDANTGEWEIRDEEATVPAHLLERQPNAHTWAERVGCPAVYEMGFRYTYPHFEPDLPEMDPTARTKGRAGRSPTPKSLKPKSEYVPRGGKTVKPSDPSTSREIRNFARQAKKR